jgi:hypothetical protein
VEVVSISSTWIIWNTSQVLSSQFSPDAQAVLSDSRHNWTQMQYASVERIDDIMLFAESECANV